MPPTNRSFKSLLTILPDRDREDRAPNEGTDLAGQLDSSISARCLGQLVSICRANCASGFHRHDDSAESHALLDEPMPPGEGRAAASAGPR